VLRRVSIFVIIILVLPYLTGCWDVEEIPRRGIANAVYFDAGNPKKFKIGVALNVPGTAIPPNVGTTQQFEKRNFVISGEGDSILEAWTEVQANTERNIFFGQVRAVVMSEKFARQDIKDMLDFIGRVPLVPPNTNVLVTKADPAKLLDLKNTSNELPGNYIDFYFRSPFKRSSAIPIDLWRVNAILDNKTGHPYIPMVEVSQNSYKIAGTAVFSRNRFADALSLDETQTLALVRGTDVGYQKIPLGGNQYAAFKNVRSETKLTPKISPDGMVSFNVNTNIQGILVEIVPHREISIKQRKLIERQAAVLLKRKFASLITKLQSLNSDPAGFADKIRIEYPQQWKTLDWDKVYPGTRFNVNTKFTVKETGLFR
jgi:spore germination protein KC